MGMPLVTPGTARGFTRRQTEKGSVRIEEECQEWLKAMRSCHYRILSHARYAHAMGMLHACDDAVTTHVWQSTRMHWACDAHAMSNVHACSDAVVTNVWQWTRVLWRGGNCLLRQAFRTHIARDRQRDTHTENTLKFHHHSSRVASCRPDTC
jgi:hypothetical protein